MSEPATKADFEQLKVELKTQLQEAVRSLEEHFTERIHDAETKLLGAFFSYQEHEKIQFQRLKVDTGNATHAAELRLDNLEQRVREIEKRILPSQ